VRRYGYVEEAERIQNLFLSGDKTGAIAAVPDELVDAVCLAGDDARLRDGLAALESAGVTGIVVGPMAPDADARRATLEAIARANS